MACVQSRGCGGQYTGKRGELSVPRPLQFALLAERTVRWQQIHIKCRVTSDYRYYGVASDKYTSSREAAKKVVLTRGLGLDQSRGLLVVAVLGLGLGI